MYVHQKVILQHLYEMSIIIWDQYANIFDARLYWSIYHVSGFHDELLKQSSFVQESLQKLKRTCTDLLKLKKHFLHGMFEAWRRTKRDIENFFYTERLKIPAYPLLEHQMDNKTQHYFVSQFISLRTALDCKESKFMFR